MRILILVAYIVAQAIYAAVAGYSTHHSAAGPLALAAVQATVTCLAGFIVAGIRGELGAAWRQVFSPQLRWKFLSLLGFGVIANLSASFAVSPSARSATTATMVDVVATIMLGWIATQVFEPNEAVPGT